MHEIGMKVGRGDGVEEERVVDALEGLTYIDGDGGGSLRGFLLVEPRGDASDEGQKS